MAGVIHSFRRRFAEDARLVREQSDCVRLVADPMSGDPAACYHGLVTGVEHLERTADGAIEATCSPVPFSIEIPDDYCRCTDGSLQLRVARIHAPIVHPNVGTAGMVCLGPRFRPGTRLLPLLEHLHRLWSSRVFASESPLDPIAAEFFRRNPDRVRALRSEPLWQRPVLGRVRIEKTQRSGEVR